MKENLLCCEPGQPPNNRHMNSRIRAALKDRQQRYRAEAKLSAGRKAAAPATFSLQASAHSVFPPSRSLWRTSCRLRRGPCQPCGSSAMQWDTFSTTCAHPCGSPTCWCSTTRYWASRAPMQVSLESSKRVTVFQPLSRLANEFAIRFFEVNQESRRFARACENKNKMKLFSLEIQFSVRILQWRQCHKQF